jgi:hypothetical protein
VITIMIVIMIAVVIVIVPVLLIVPAMLVLVPPFVVLAPAVFASFVQLVPGMIGFGTGRAMVLDSLVQPVVCLLDAVPALIVFVVCTRARHSREAQQRYSYDQRCQQPGHSLRIACCRVIHANFSMGAVAPNERYEFPRGLAIGEFPKWSEEKPECRLSYAAGEKALGNHYLFSAHGRLVLEDTSIDLPRFNVGTVRALWQR